MAQGFRKIHQLPRDGTSRTGRWLDALDPASAPIDSRTLDQMLAQVDQLARQFHWFDDNGQPSGTWDCLLEPVSNGLKNQISAPDQTAARPEILALLARLAEDPSILPAAQRERFLPPHVALILTVLRLLDRAREQTNGLTARHLDFLFDSVLKFQPRPAEVDRVNVIIHPSNTGRALRLPAGTLLDAGADDTGQPRVYATERELVVNKARVADLKSIHAQIDLVGLTTVRQTASSLDQPGLELMKLALGDPLPGDPLPPMTTFSANPELIPDEALLRGPVRQWINFAREHLYLDFYELRDLVALKTRRDNDKGDWSLIDRVMAAIHRRRTGSSARGQSGVPAGKDFDAKLVWALGQEPDFSEVAEVETVYDLYALRDRDEVREFLKRAPYSALASSVRGAALPVMSPDVVSMMSRKLQIDAEWDAINDHLQNAGRQSQDSADFVLQARRGFDPTAFDANLAAALPALKWTNLPVIGTQKPPDGVQTYIQVIERIEAYLHMSAESARFLLNQALPDLIRNQDPSLWTRADTILCETRARRNIATRKADLQAVMDAAGADPSARVRAVLGLALERAVDAGTPVASYVADANPLLNSDADRQTIASIQAAVDIGGSGKVNWTALITVAEKVMRSRLGSGADLPEQRIWRNLLAYTDATALQQEQAEGTPDADPRWRTFGDTRGGQDANARLGWAFSSPILAMRQGVRKVTLTQTFDAADLTQTQIAQISALFTDPEDPPLKINISGADGWINGGSVGMAPIKLREQSALQMVTTVELGVSDPAVVAPLDDAGITSDDPVLSLIVQNRSAQSARDQGTYAALRALQMLAAKCTVDVGNAKARNTEIGLTQPLLRSDQGLVDSSKPFLPFGSSPVLGSRLMLADPELMTKRLTALTLAMEWKGVPQAKLKDHYAGYSDEKTALNSKFTFDLDVVDRNAPVRVLSGALFDGGDANLVHTATTGEMGRIETPPPEAPGRGVTDPIRWDRYFRITLTGRDFGHRRYPVEAARAGTKTPPVVLEPPYTPELKSLGISYRAETEWNPVEDRVMDVGEMFLHLHPFGQSRAGVQGNGRVRFLPSYDHAGELLIGLDDTDAPQRVSLLFQMAEGSADPDLAPAPIRFSCLDGETWMPLEQGEVRYDATRGLINSGVIEIDLPGHGSGTLMPGAKTWLRLSVDRDTTSLCDTVSILTQAVPAVFVDQDNDPSHYANPLAPETITRTVRPQAGIREICQPFTSYGGRPAEAVDDLRARASERLRHRNRAVSFWDYERLVLDRFPQLYKAKCLPAENGGVRVVVIPDVSEQRPSDPFEPKAPTNVLADIQSYLQTRAPMGVGVTVTNARFVPVKIRVAIQFHAGVDVRLARTELNEALKRFLSPWAYHDSEDIVIGGAIWSNSIIDFLARQSTVDYVRAPRLFRYDAGTARYVEEPANNHGGYRLAAREADEVLVSARDHEIDQIRADIEDQQELTGVGYMKLGLDFIVDEATGQQDQEEPA